MMAAPMVGDGIDEDLPSPTKARTINGAQRDACSSSCAQQKRHPKLRL
jgi:hypothetical protein